MNLMLGTAQWGWTVSPQTAFLLLDQWLENGEKRIDCATNYPINKQPGAFRAAEKILNEYIKAHGLTDLEITMKVGSLDNLRSPENNLSPSFIQMMAGEYRRLFGNNLKVLMLHWDNRDAADEIAASLDALRRLEHTAGLRSGLSGLKHPTLHAALAARLGMTFDIQMKRNLLYSDIPRYRDFPPDAHRYWVYGIHAGGLKSDGAHKNPESTYALRGGNPEFADALLSRLRQLISGLQADKNRPALSDIHQLSLLFAVGHPDVYGVLLGVSSPLQLASTFTCRRLFAEQDYSDVYAALEKIAV